MALVFGCDESMHRTPDADAANLIETGDARVVKQDLHIPVMICGVHDPMRAAQAIAEGHGDLLMLARPMLADPDYARKVTEGRFADIVHCDRNGTCMKRLMTGMPIRCTKNPRIGIEGRAEGAFPPFDRMLKASVEKLAIAAMRSKKIMDPAGRLVKSEMQD